MLRRIIASLILAGLALAAIGFMVEMQTPVVHPYRVAMPDWPRGMPPVRIAFLSDIHVAGPDMPPSRLAGIVDQVNALAPDCVLIAGDFISDKWVATRAYSFADAVRPLAGLRARRVIAVAGNHDFGPDGSPAAMLAALRDVGAMTLSGGATRCGALAVAGVDYPFKRHWQLPEAVPAAQRLGGPALLLTHTPSIFVHRGARSFRLVVAGHTHCGQIALPWFGAIFTATDIGRRYACGMVQEKGRVLIVGPGLGTSGVPMRLFTRPEILLIEVGGRRGTT